MPFTCQVMILSPPFVCAENWYVDTTLTEAVAGAMVTVMPVVESVHEEFDVDVDDVEVVVAQVTVGPAADEPHDVRLITAVSKTK